MGGEGGVYRGRWGEREVEERYIARVEWVPYSGKSSHGSNFRAHANFAKIRTAKFRTREFFNWRGQL